MNDARTDNPNDATQPSIESARETAVRGLAQRATSGSLTLDEYAERVLAVEQAASAEELDAALLLPIEENSRTSLQHRARAQLDGSP